MTDNNFSILLQALLDESASKEKINEGIGNIQKNDGLKSIQLKATFDSNSIIEQINKAVNQKITISNIDINQGQLAKSVQQIGSGMNTTLSKSLGNVKRDINNIIKSFDNTKLNSYNLSKIFNLDNAKIDTSIIQQVRTLTTELNMLGKEAVKTNSDNAWEGIVTKINSLSQILTKFGSSRDLTPFKESLDILNYFQDKKIFVGNKADVLSNTGMNVRELNNQFSNLGITFTTVSKNATNLDMVWSELCSISPNLQQFSSFGNQINAVVEHLKTAKEALYGKSNLQPVNENEVSSMLVKWLGNIEELSKRVTILKEEYAEFEKQSTANSTSAATTVIQNEEKKQQAYRETAQAQKQIAKDESLIKSGANVITFEHTNNAAKEAAATFKELLKDENAVISTSERFGKSNGLTSFTVNVKRATGEVESLRYALETVKDQSGNATRESFFKNTGAELNNANAIRQTQAVENAFSNYTAKLEQFKSTNNNILSGLSAPLSDFENKLNGLRGGTVTIDELKNSFSMLNAEASKVTSKLSGQLSKVDAAIRNIATGEETISELRAEFKGLSNTPKEINSELNKLTMGLQDIKKIENQEGRTVNWAEAYRKWEQAVDSLRAKLRVLVKEQANVASTQVFQISDLRKANIPYMTKVSNTTEKQMAEIQKMARAQGWQNFDVKGVEQADGLIKKLTLTVTDAEGALKKLNFQREKLQGYGKAQFGLMQTGDIQVLKTASKAQEELAQKTTHANEKLDEQRTKLANKIQLSLDTDGYESKVETLISRTRQWTDEQGNARISTEALSKAFQNLNAAHDALSKNNTAANQQALINAEKELDTQIKTVTNSVRTMNAQLAKNSTISSLHNQIQEFYDKNSAAHSKWGMQLKRMLAETASGAKLTHEQVQKIASSFNNVGMAARQAGRLGKSFTQTLKEGMRSFSYWTSSTFLVMKTIQSIKKAVSTVKDLDTALVDLKKTTTMTVSQLEEFYYSSNDVAKQMGVTTQEIITQASAWSRLGFQSAEAATKMAKYSSMFASISPGMDVDTATNGLVSVMKAFDIGNDNPDEVLDGIMSKINVIGNTAATSNAEIVNMLAKSSSAMREANNTLEQTIALETAAVEITRDDDSVGTAFKTVAMRIRGKQTLPPYKETYMLCA